MGAICIRLGVGLGACAADWALQGVAGVVAGGACMRSDHP